MGLLDRYGTQSVMPEENTQNESSNSGFSETRETSDKLKPALEDKYEDVKNRIHALIIEQQLGAENADISDEGMKKLINEFVERNDFGIPRVDRDMVKKDLFDDIMGYGPIQPLIDSDAYSEIMVNGCDHVYVESKGKLVLTDIKFKDNEHLMQIIDRIVSKVGRHVDESSPMCDARLLDGSRVNVIIPPLSLVGPILTIRKFGKTPITADNLVAWGSVSRKMLEFLEAAVRGKLNIIVSGGTGSGKTTLLNVLSSYIPSDERIITIEDSAEVQLHQEHVLTLESRPANMEGKGRISIRDLVVNALRMRPDRIIVGEVRSEETLDMLQAMNTGHDGSLTTIHANSPRDSISRIETMVMMSGSELPSKAIRDQVASAINLIVQQARLRDGSRKITSVSEIVGMEGDVIRMQDIFTYETDGEMDANGKFKGEFKATGIVPKCIEKIRENGVMVSNEWFND
ncbi:CpaF family protein [Eubacterium sp.]|uniref:CpaF family protein n=1 Tax=Eubacterium sp. TaxID=142586 RepID=UPI0025C4F4CB|nr:CpaF family protein [Eubacterium sp.]MCI7800484.1 CpaF family protein [Eubacterium sp.]MDY3811262.1 CpaF family protein [Eubacterium sp.]